MINVDYMAERHPLSPKSVYAESFVIECIADGVGNYNLSVFSRCGAIDVSFLLGEAKSFVRDSTDLNLKQGFYVIGFSNFDEEGFSQFDGDIAMSDDEKNTLLGITKRLFDKHYKPSRDEIDAQHAQQAQFYLDQVPPNPNN